MRRIHDLLPAAVTLRRGKKRQNRSDFAQRGQREVSISAPGAESIMPERRGSLREPIAGFAELSFSGGTPTGVDLAVDPTFRGTPGLRKAGESPQIGACSARGIKHRRAEAFPPHGHADRVIAEFVTPSAILVTQRAAAGQRLALRELARSAASRGGANGVVKHRRKAGRP